MHMGKSTVLIILILSLPLAVMAFSIEGRYSVEVDTPVGLEKGFVIVEKTPDKDTYHGILNLWKHDNEFKEARCDGRSFEFSSKLRYSVFRIKFTCSGTIDEKGSLVAVAGTLFGKMNVRGSKDNI